MALYGFFRSILKNALMKYSVCVSRRNIRAYLAAKYLRGQGIEIGALNGPVTVPSGAAVKYVDIFSADEVRRRHPELKQYRLVDVDIIDDGERLDKIESGSLDFVVAIHFLEHCQDPIGALEAALRVLKKRGILYIVVPDKRFTFDADRPVTSIEHLIRDHKEGPAVSRKEHAGEWSAMVDEKFKDSPPENIEKLKNDDYIVHYHVWTYFDMMALLAYLNQALGGTLAILEFAFKCNEGIFIIEKA